MDEKERLSDMFGLRGFSLDEWLRYILSGGVFLIVLKYVGFPMGFLSTPKFSPLSNPSSWIFISAILGCLIYSIHRLSIYPLMRLIITSIAYCGCLDCLLPKEEECFSKKWWEMEHGESSKEPYFFARPLSEWASQVHFIYCSCEAVFWASFFSCLYGGACLNPALLVLTILAGIGAFLADIRLTRFALNMFEENNIYRTESR